MDAALFIIKGRYTLMKNASPVRPSRRAGATAFCSRVGVRKDAATLEGVPKVFISQEQVVDPSNKYLFLSYCAF
jgi:hypothetical protein